MSRKRVVDEQSGRCGCGGCKQVFASLGAFDFHRAGPYSARHCMTTGELRAKGFRQDARGWWRFPGRIVGEEAEASA